MEAPPTGKRKPRRAALYVHVPFCVVKCAYCDFYSLAGAEHRADAYLDAVARELDAALAAAFPGNAADTVGPVGVETVFLGGGTPTRLTAPQLGRLGRILHDRLTIPPGTEWTVEANPATIDADKAAALLEMGANRVSLGAQSFRDDELRLLGREHDAAAIGRTVRLVREAGFRRLNLDLIFGLPGQSLATWQRHLETALDLGPDHLSCYNLTFEPGTEFTRRLKQGRMSVADPEVERRMYDHTRARLADAGFAQYEISNFARPGEECRHNLVYWDNRDHLALGPSAVGCIGGERRRNIVNLERWMESVARTGRGEPASLERLTGPALWGETAMLQLRLRRGLDVAAFQVRYGVDPLELFARPVAKFGSAGLLEVADGCVRLTEAGLWVSDGIFEEFVLPG